MPSCFTSTSAGSMGARSAFDASGGNGRADRPWKDRDQSTCADWPGGKSAGASWSPAVRSEREEGAVAVED